MRKPAEKQQSQVQTIQGKVTGRNVTQDNGNVNAWGPFIISYDQNQENGCLENYIHVRAFKNRPVPTDQVFCTRYMLCLLQSWRFQLKAVPGETMQRAQNSRLSCILSNAHVIFALIQMQRCVWKPFVQRNIMTSSKKFSFNFLKIAENFSFFIFCIHNKQWSIAKWRTI